MNLGGMTITIINNGGPIGANGIGEPTYADPILTVVVGCDIQQRHTHRDIALTDATAARHRLFAPPGAPLLPTSRVAVGAFTSLPLPDGTTVYLMDGEPAVWRQHNGTTHHIECYLREQAG